MNHCSKIVLGVAVSMFLASALDAMPAAGAAAEPTNTGDLGADSLLQRTCLESTSAAGGLTVRECLSQACDTAEEVTTALTFPDRLLQIVGAELQWMSTLLPAMSQPGERHGEYTRLAGLQNEDLTELAAHPFSLKIDGDADVLSFQLQLESHRIRQVEAEVRGDATAFVVFTYADGAGQRTVLFEDGVPVHDSGSVAASRASSFYMGCFIDTPAYDQYRRDVCFRFGSQPSTVAFRVFLPYTPQSVVWLTPSSSCSGLVCIAPISPNQTVYGYAYWIINGTPTGPVSATAHYELEPGF